MAKKKYYAVKLGRVPGLYETWDDCKAQVDHYSGAIYKAFYTKEEAEAYLSGERKSKKTGDLISIEEIQNIADIVCYVDGSYKHDTKEFSYGVVCFYQGKEYHFQKKYDDPEMAEMRNISGEVYGAMKALSIAEAKGAQTLAIFHDYQGIASWPLREWKTTKNGTRRYVLYYDQVIAKGVKVTFHKVAGHTGVKYNELADQLAKEALGIA